MKWVTRERVKVDRVACPWLIQKFIDPQAEFLFVKPELVIRTAAEEKAIPYDVPGVELGHHGGKCSFEAIVEKYQLQDPAILMLSSIVHSADVKQDLYECAEAPGLHAIAEGFYLLQLTDQEVLQKQFPLYDALYEYCRAKTSALP